MSTPIKHVILPGSRLDRLRMSKDEVVRACAQSVLQSQARKKFPAASAAPVADFPNYHCRPDSALPNCPDMPPPPIDKTQPVPGCAPAAAIANALEIPFLEFLLRTGATPTATVTNAIVLVTPAIAHAWLQHNRNNRKPSATKIVRFAAAMKAGRWTLTGEPIKFDVTGELLDGQSRLRAILRSDTSVLLEVRWGLPRLAQEAMDTGEARSHAHQLQMAGVTHPIDAASALRTIWGWDRGNNAIGETGFWSANTRSLISNTSIRETLERHPGIIESLQRYAGHMAWRKILPLSRTAAYHYIFATIDRAKATSFWDSLTSGVGIEEGSPVHQLRERLVADKLSQARMNRREQAALIIKAWGAHLAGERLRSLHFRTKGDDPEAFPAIAGDLRPGKAGVA